MPPPTGRRGRQAENDINPRITAAHLIDDPYRSIVEHLADLRTGYRLDALAIDGDDRSSVSAAFDYSYAALKPEAQRLFRLLGQVPGPDFTPEAAAALSDMPPVDARRLLDRLVAACLVEHRARDRYALHDLLRDLMGAELKGGVETAHNAILEAYTKTKQGDGWHTAPDDGYLYTHLAYHLLALDRKEELCSLLTASPAWMEAKFKGLHSIC